MLSLKKLNIPYKSCKTISDFNKITKIILPNWLILIHLCFVKKKKIGHNY